MEKPRRFLLITDHEGRLVGSDGEVDITSWERIAEIGNLADYDGWVINVPASAKSELWSVERIREIRELFSRKTFLDVVQAGGEVIVVGDLGTAPHAYEAVISHAAPQLSQIDPLGGMIRVKTDPRPVHYGRVARPEAQRHSGVYEYLDQVTRWTYSLIIEGQVGGVTVTRLGTSNFGTCLAAFFEVFKGSVLLLPSLGTSCEADDNYILEHFLGLTSGVSAPDWAQRLVVPEQLAKENRLRDLEIRQAELLTEIEGEKGKLIKVQRWKRLLYDDSFSLEEIVKEAFQTLGATVTKPLKEKDDFRIAVAGQPRCVLEVKGTRKDQFGKKDLRQLSEWMEDLISEEPSEVKGVFVGNAARESEPRTRGKMFDANNIAYARVKRMTVLRTVDLYCLTLLELTGVLDKARFWQELFATVGEFNANEYWKILPPEFSLAKPVDNNTVNATDPNP